LSLVLPTVTMEAGEGEYRVDCRERSQDGTSVATMVVRPGSGTVGHHAARRRCRASAETGTEGGRRRTDWGIVAAWINGCVALIRTFSGLMGVIRYGTQGTGSGTGIGLLD